MQCWFAWGWLRELSQWRSVESNISYICALGGASAIRCFGVRRLGHRPCCCIFPARSISCVSTWDCTQLHRKLFDLSVPGDLLRRSNFTRWVTCHCGKIEPSMVAFQLVVWGDGKKNLLALEALARKSCILQLGLPFLSSGARVLTQFCCWSIWSFSAVLKINELGETELLRLIKLGCEQGLAFQAIHRHGIWLPAGCRKQIFEMANGFCKTYSRLAALAYSQRLTLFGLVPKAHALGHIYFDLERTKNNSFSINPATWDTSSSEDFVGRVSRQSRRIGYRCIVSNTLLAYKVKANFVIQRFGKSRRRQWPFGFQLLIPKLRCWKCHLQ